MNGRVSSPGVNTKIFAENLEGKFIPGEGAPGSLGGGGKIDVSNFRL